MTKDQTRAKKSGEQNTISDLVLLEMLEATLALRRLYALRRHRLHFEQTGAAALIKIQITACNGNKTRVQDMLTLLAIPGAEPRAGDTTY